MNEEYDVVANMLMNGYNLDYGLISISTIYDKFINDNGYVFQVHTTHTKGWDENDLNKGSYIFEKLDPAVRKFLEVKERCYGKSTFN